MKMRNLRLASLCTAAVLACAAGTSVATDETIKGPGGSPFTLTTGRVFHQPEGPISNFRTIAVPGTATVLYLWDEGGSPYYAISRDGGNSIAGRVRETDYTIRLQYANFDPLKFTPGVNEQLLAPAGSEMHLVQFWTVPLEEFQTQIEQMGGEIVRFMANHTHIVRMPANVAAQVAQLPYVRWTGPFHTAYKLSGEILSAFVVGAPERLADYSIEVFDRGAAQQNALAAAIVAAGGRVININGLGYRMTVTIAPSQILALARRDELHYIDPWGPGELDTDLAKILNGVTNSGGGPSRNIAALGFTGRGVDGEIFDTGVNNHVALQPRLQHGTGGTGSHGTNVAGIPFASRFGGMPGGGFLPDRDKVIWSQFSQSSQFGGPVSRHLHTAQLVDAAGPYRTVWQTSSVGSPRNSVYTSISAETDDYLFIHQLLSTQSMSNAGLVPQTRPQAWAKNIVGVGGVQHLNNLNKLDDSARGSTGPAQDGRIKPDLTHHYDAILTTSGTTGVTTSFGGTSGATPSTVGNFGLLFQMWHMGVFPGHGGGATVFDSRPKMVTAKAMMINQADRYDFNSGGANASFWRDRQGWGMADVGNLHAYRNKMMIHDEAEPINPLETHSFDFDVAPGEPTFYVTMSYADPMGPTSASQHRINDLSLRVTSPSGTVYWGNNGLRSSNFSTPGGVSNTKDTVENVFIQNPQAGIWTIEVIADEIVQDGHVETPALDADYALVASGGQEVLGVSIRTVSTLPDLVLPSTPVDVTVSIIPGNSSIVPNSEEAHYRLSGGAFTTVPLTPIGNSEYTMTVPGASCGDLPEFYFSAGDVVAGTTVFLPSPGPASPFSYQIGEIATTAMLAADFEGGLPGGWVATGLWNVTSACSPSTPCNGTSWAYFGQPANCTYSTGARATGSLFSPVIAIPNFPAGGGATLSYCYNYEREGNPAFDKAEVYVNGDRVDQPDPTNTWDTRQIDLASYRGTNVVVEFRFDSIDSFQNGFRGWQVDDVRIEVRSTVCNACPCACDWDPNPVCNIMDFMAFQTAFVAGEPCACDFDPDPACNIFDFLAFQNQFVLGCP
ncbi:MAG: S8 family serine peptidase [Planctomycetes bacterium]|nr:S8 family serine peptidase [Planctomycetota bacterium]